MKGGEVILIKGKIKGWVGETAKAYRVAVTDAPGGESRGGGVLKNKYEVQLGGEMNKRGK